MEVPAYMMIRQYAVDLVMRSPECEVKMLSERELCKMFNVTRPTVRKALKDLIDDNFLIIRPGLGTYTNPSKALHEINASQEIVSLGIIVADGKHVNYHAYFGEIMIGAFKEAVSKGGAFRIVNIMQKGLKAVENISLLNLNAIMWINPPENMLDIIDGLEESGIPVAVVNKTPACKSQIYVGFDDEYEGYITAKQFLDHGHKNVLLVINPNLPADLERLAGFKKCFEDNGEQFNEEYLLETGDNIEAKLQEVMTSNINEITGFYVLKYEILKTVDTFIELKKKSGAPHMIITLEYIMRFKPDLVCHKIIAPLAEAGQLAAEKLSERVMGTSPQHTGIKLKSKITNPTN